MAEPPKTLPPELIQLIVAHLSENDLCRFRQVSRGFHDASLQRFGETFFTDMRVSLSKKGLKALKRSLAHPIFGPCITRVDLMRTPMQTNDGFLRLREIRPFVQDALEDLEDGVQLGQGSFAVPLKNAVIQLLECVLRAIPYYEFDRGWIYRYTWGQIDSPRANITSTNFVEAKCSLTPLPDQVAYVTTVVAQNSTSQIVKRDASTNYHISFDNRLSYFSAPSRRLGLLFNSGGLGELRCSSMFFDFTGKNSTADHKRFERDLFAVFLHSLNLHHCEVDSDGTVLLFQHNRHCLKRLELVSIDRITGGMTWSEVLRWISENLKLDYCKVTDLSHGCETLNFSRTGARGIREGLAAQAVWLNRVEIKPRVD